MHDEFLSLFQRAITNINIQLFRTGVNILCMQQLAETTWLWSMRGMQTFVKFDAF